jgi:MscS family membrane protein
MDIKQLLDFFHLNTSLSREIYAFCIFFAFMLLRFFFSRIVITNIKKFTAKTKNKFDDILIETLEKPLSFLFIAIGIFFAKSVVELSPFVDAILNHIVQSIILLSIFLIFYNSIEPISLKIQNTTTKYGKELSKDLASFITKTLKFIVIAIGISTIFQEWGYNVGAFLASLGLIGMAFALAAKDTAANLFGSLVIFGDRPFRIGDWIKTPDVEGIVEEIGVRSTKVRTFAKALVTVPNAVLANSAILNWSKMNKRRIKMTLGLTYDTSHTQMNDIIADIKSMLNAHDDIDKDVIYIYFTDFDASSLGIFCYFFTTSTKWDKYMSVRENVNLKIMEIVQKHKASFAFPSQSIYLENTDIQEKALN